MDLKIINGTVVTGAETYKAQVGVKSGKVVSIAQKIEGGAERVIDAKGMYVMPGGIDVHTHLDMPFCGTVSSDDFETGTKAAAHGGTTCIVDFAIQSKGGTLHDAVEAWKARAEGKAVIDYGFHVAVTDLSPEVMDEIPQMVKAGVPSLKCFLAYKGALMIDDGALLQVLQKAKKSNALVMIHAENGDVIDVLVKEALAKGQTAPKYHALSRPPEVEGEATERGITIARMAEAPLFIVHLSCMEALNKVKRARAMGEPIYAETCPQYLLRSFDNYLERGFNGAKYVMSPPLRDKSNWPKLWQGLADGFISSVSTDHAPFNFKGQKEMGLKSFADIPNGAGGIEHRLILMFEHGVNQGRIGLNRFVELVSAAPAKMFGMYPNKGTVAVGSDADLVIFDPKKEYRISAKTHHQNVDYTPYEGFTGQGAPQMVISGGKVIVEDDQFVGEAGAGRFVKRKAFKLSEI